MTSLDGSLGTKEAQQIVPSVVKAINDPKYDTVIATLDTHDENYLHSQEGKYLPVAHCIKETDGWQLVKEVKEALDKRHAKVIEKPTFGSLTLCRARYQRCSRKRSLLSDYARISASSAMPCMLQAALYRKIVCAVLKDGCAPTTPEKHIEALHIMESCQIEVK